SPFGRLARTSPSPTRSGPEGSSRNEFRSGRCPVSHLIPATQVLKERAISMDDSVENLASGEEVPPHKPDPATEPGFNLGDEPAPAPVKGATPAGYQVLARKYRPTVFEDL